MLYDHCGHFHMIVMCFIKLLICFTLCLLDRIFTCYIILILLLLALPWGSNALCASVLGYIYCVPNSSHVLDLGVSKFCHCSQTHFKSKVCYRVFCHEIAKWRDCKVVIFNYVLCWLYSMTKSVVTELIYFLVFCGILLYWV